MRLQILVTMTVLVMSNFVQAQVKTNYNNPDSILTKGYYNKDYKAQLYQVAIPDTQKLKERAKAEAAEEGKLRSKPYRIAEPILTGIDVADFASWVTEGDKAYGKFAIQAKKAKSLSIYFSPFYLPQGTEMFIYNEHGKMITGPITPSENNERQGWGSSIFKGDALTIEIVIPTTDKPKLKLNISNVAYGYKEIFAEKVGYFGDAGVCNINVLCPDGNAWAAERNSVALIVLDDGSRVGTGVLVRSTCNVNIPYFLTANHNYDDPIYGIEDLSKWRIQFQAWSTTCPNPGVNTDGLIFNGASYRANWDRSEFALVVLNQTPAANSGIRYAGWTRSTTAATSGVGIHHPSGDLMKISTYTTPVTRADNYVWPTGADGYPLDPAGDFHWIVSWNRGVTEGGSSGSPLFDQNHRIIGQLSGGPSGCGKPIEQDAYGRFDNSWTGGGTDNTRLSNWLDPSNTNAMTTNTTNISALVAPLYPSLSISGADLFCTGSSTYNVSGVPAGASILWSNSNATAGSIPSPSTGTSVVLTRVSSGSTVLTATVRTCTGIFKPSKTVHINMYGSSDYPVTGPSSTYCNYYVTYTTNQLPGATSYTWFYPAGWTYVDGQGTYMLTLIANGSTGTYQIGVRVNNTCGTGGSYAIMNTFLNGCSGFAAYQISPNPATNEVTVTPSETGAKSTTAPAITEVNIYDQRGALRKSQKFGRVRKATVNLSGLSTGVYFIEIVDGTNKVRQQLSVLK